MARTLANERFLPSLLDRLTDDDPINNSIQLVKQKVKRIEKELTSSYRNSIINSPNLDMPQIKDYILQKISLLKKRIKIVDNRQRIYDGEKYIENPNYNKVVFYDKFPNTPQELLNSANFLSYANFAGYKSENAKKNIEKIYNNLISDTYGSLKNNFIADKTYLKLLNSIFKPEETAKNYLFKQDTRMEELNNLSNKLSQLSGVEIRLEQKENSTKEILDYLKEVNNNIFKTVL